MKEHNTNGNTVVVTLYFVCFLVTLWETVASIVVKLSR